MRHIVPAYLHLTLSLFNAFFIFQILLGFLFGWYATEQWIIVLGNFVLIFTGVIAIERKHADHFSPGEATIYQFIFFILGMASAVGLLILLIAEPKAFMNFMPFEFFVLAFMVAFYFFVTRFIFPHKRLRL